LRTAHRSWCGPLIVFAVVIVIFVNIYFASSLLNVLSTVILGSIQDRLHGRDLLRRQAIGVVGGFRWVVVLIGSTLILTANLRGATSEMVLGRWQTARRTIATARIIQPNPSLIVCNLFGWTRFVVPIAGTLHC
jgi:hypothetical protein